MATMPRPTIVTLLAPAERSLVNAAADDAFIPVHRHSLTHAWRELGAGKATGILVSLAGVASVPREALAALRYRHPTVHMMGLVCERPPEAYTIAATLGAAGVMHIVDVSGADAPLGWSTVRTTMRTDTDPQYARTSMLHIDAMLDAGNVSRDHTMRTLLAVLFDRERPRSTITIARHIGMHVSTLRSRMFRRGLPGLSEYVHRATLIRVARLTENRHLSIARISLVLGCSSPQALGRSIRCYTGLTAMQFRTTMTAATALDVFCERLITPYLTRWAAGADPLVAIHAHAKTT